MPPRDVEIDDALVRALLEDQHPDLAALPLRRVAFGWDNELFRLGDDLVVRLPRRLLAAPAAAHELRWLPVLAAGLPLPVPAPIRAGVPALGYPYLWSICRWFEGTTAVEAALSHPAQAAEVLGSFVGALHLPASEDAPTSPFRGIPLVERDELTRGFMAELDDQRGRTARRVWERALAATPHTGEKVWLHGDLHPGNLLVDGGTLRAVIDFGDMGAGDPAVDLAAGWMLLDDPAHREVFRVAAGGCDDPAWLRAQGWALAIGSAVYVNSADNPLMHRMGLDILRRVLGPV